MSDFSAMIQSNINSNINSKGPDTSMTPNQNRIVTDRARREFLASRELQSEFGDEGIYIAYRRAVAAGSTADRPPPAKEQAAADATPSPVMRLEARSSSAHDRAALVATWNRFGPSDKRVRCSALLSRFRDFGEFADHVARHALGGRP